MIFNDTPNFWDAWGRSIWSCYLTFSTYLPHTDVEIHHLETHKPLKFDKITVLEEGPLRASVLAQLTYGKSIILVVVRSLLLSDLLP